MDDANRRSLEDWSRSLKAAEDAAWSRTPRWRRWWPTSRARRWWRKVEVWRARRNPPPIPEAWRRHYEGQRDRAGLN